VTKLNSSQLSTTNAFALEVWRYLVLRNLSMRIFLDFRWLLRYAVTHDASYHNVIAGVFDSLAGFPNFNKLQKQVDEPVS
jgi:hypothetical protein